MTRDDCLDAARACVMQDRERTYGPPVDSFRTVAALWSAILGRDVRPHEVILCLDALKTARLMATPAHADSWIDKAGYAAIGAEVAMADAGRG